MPPARTERSARALQVVAAARRIVEDEGRDALTMRRLGDELGIRAPSLYKHFPDKAAVELALIEEALAEVGTELHRAVSELAGRAGGARSATDTKVERLLLAYRAYGVAHPHLYRLATSGPFARDRLPPGLDEWAGTPFFLATGEPHRAQALWSMAHGMVILEIDGRYADPDPRHLDATWRAAAEAFA